MDYKFLSSKLKRLDFKSAQLIRNITLSFLIKGAAIIVSLLTLPVYISYFSDNLVLGMWFTAISLLSWILTFDLGIGNGLRNHLVSPLINKDNQEIRKNISSAYISVGIIVLFLSVLSFFIIPLINWNVVFNVPSYLIDGETLSFMATMLITGILIQFFLKLVSSIFYSLQKSAIPGLLILVSSISMLLFAFFIKNDDLDMKIKLISIAYVFATNIPYLIATLVLFSTKLKTAKPSFKYFESKYALRIIKLGGIFFYLQILTMIMFNTNELLISWLINPAEVVQFQVYNKLFSVVSTFFNLALTPVWSAVTEARVKNDYIWIKLLYKKLNLSLLLLIPLQAILILLFPYIIDFWLRDSSIDVSYTHGIIFAVYNILFMKVSIDTSIIAGFGKLKIQSVSLTFTTILKILLSIIIIQYTESWIFIVTANIFALLPYIIIEYFDIKYRFAEVRE
ncbi:MULTISPECIES: hypothetical protein [unclassified Exiguobacterium]|uniref:hypothetical protein n=1 Tax=unclassified Exiguobacterium TaxID=2644629 RepID=UPI001BE75154|nr:MULTISPECIES: hypothetical protein [unclassified Exiguobacterium]